MKAQADSQPAAVLSDAGFLRELESGLLSGALARRRWFAGKGRQIRRVQILDRTLPDGLLGHAGVLLLVGVELSGGDDHLYLMPLTLGGAEHPDGSGEPLVAAGGLVVRDDLDDPLPRRLVEVIQREQTIATAAGSIRSRTTQGAASLIEAGLAESPVLSRAEQSHSSVVFGQVMILKLFRRLERGTNPDLEVGRFLAEQTAFDRVPRMLGWLEYVGGTGEGEPVTLGLLQEWVPNQGTGWEHALQVLRRDLVSIASGAEDWPPAALDEATVLDHLHASPPPALIGRLGEYLPFAAALGRRTAELHLALSSRHDVAGFQPLPVRVADLRAWSDETGRLVETGIDLLRQRLHGLGEPALSLARRVVEAKRELLSKCRVLERAQPDALKIRIHGDYHLGQVLRQGDDFVILDFEGEPLRSLESRRQPQVVWKDLAGMLRSFDYASSTALAELASSDARARQRLEPWAAAWRSWMSATFLRRYLERAGEAGFVGRDPGSRRALLPLFLLDKAVYELHYELSHRPEWVAIPLRGLLSLLDRPESLDDVTPSEF